MAVLIVSVQSNKRCKTTGCSGLVDISDFNLTPFEEEKIVRGRLRRIREGCSSCGYELATLFRDGVMAGRTHVQGYNGNGKNGNDERSVRNAYDEFMNLI